MYEIYVTHYDVGWGPLKIRHQCVLKGHRCKISLYNKLFLINQVWIPLNDNAQWNKAFLISRISQKRNEILTCWWILHLLNYSFIHLQTIVLFFSRLLFVYVLFPFYYNLFHLRKVYLMKISYVFSYMRNMWNWNVFA